MEEDYIIFFSGEGGRKVERRVKKMQVTTESLAQYSRGTILGTMETSIHSILYFIFS